MVKLYGRQKSVGTKYLESETAIFLLIPLCKGPFKIKDTVFLFPHIGIKSHRYVGSKIGIFKQ